MIYGYDLDGVLAPDIVCKEWSSVFNDLRTQNIKPLFYPEGDYFIISGRPDIDRIETLLWIDTFFTEKNKPLDFINGLPISKAFDDKEVASFKAHHIIKNSIDVFFESSKEQTELIQYKVKNISKIYHWESFINEKIHEL